MNTNNSVKLGSLGEQFAAKALGLYLSEDQYDSKKDGIKDNLTYEIKTQNRYAAKNVFSIAAPCGGNGLVNVLKCFTVDHLLFVEYDHSNDVKIWECTDRTSYIIYTTRPYTNNPNGKTMIAFPIDKMILLYQKTDANLASKMRHYSNSREFKDY